MVKVVAKNFTKEDNFDEIMKLEKELVEETHKEAGNISYELFQDTEHPEILTMIETWKTREDLEKHLNSPHFTRIVPMLGEYMTKEAEVDVYEKLI